jgi:hypothetical protein
VSDVVPETIADSLIAAVMTNSDSAAGRWLQDMSGQVPSDEDRFLTAYAGAARRLRGSRSHIDAHCLEALRGSGVLGAERWSAARAVRTALLIRALSIHDTGAATQLARKVFRTGDNDERVALLGSLLLLEKPEAHLDLAVDACRSHVTEVFEAIACENAYPSRLFPDENFNQMVMKAVFIEVPLDRVVGLDARRNGELSRMAKYYAQERTAAGRSVPADLAIITCEAG